jgi:hypothetical protein
MLERSRHNGKVSFNFTEEQQDRFTLLYAETKKVYPELVEDDIQRERTKVVLAHYIINEEKINCDLKENEVKVEEIKDTIISKGDDTE